MSRNSRTPRTPRSQSEVEEEARISHAMMAMSAPGTMYVQHPQTQLAAYWPHPMENTYHHEHDQYVAVALQPVATELQMKQHPNLLPPCGDVKPRLTKDQHELLETHFRGEPKPTTQTKKDIAETLQTTLDKINNWFQNRRAKVKQDAKKQEMNQRNLINVLPNAQISVVAVPPRSRTSQVPPFGQPGTTDDDSGSGSRPSTRRDFGNAAFIPGTGQPSSGQQNVGNPTFSGYEVPESVPDLNGFTVPRHLQAEGQSMRFQLSRPHMVSGSRGDVYYPSPPTEMGAYQSQSDSDEPHITIPHDQANTQVDGSMTDDSMQCSSTMNPPFPEATGFRSWPLDGEPSISIQTADAFDEISNSNPGLESVHSTPIVSSECWPSQVQTDSLLPGHSYQQVDHSASLTGQQNEMLGNHAQPDMNGSLNAARRRSSAAGITDTLLDSNMQDPDLTESPFKQPTRTGLGDRRARRPANLTVPRSASYSHGMSGPASPGNLSATHAADLSLRRIRSSGLGASATGRIQKSTNPTPTQRSPHHLNFADAANFAYANTQTSSGPGTEVALGPLTPLTPADLSQPWMHGIGPCSEIDGIHSSPDSYNPAGMSFALSSATSSVFPPGMGTGTSPPTTPMDADQVLKHQSFMNVRAQQMHYTPPQSAPATQQTFGPAAMVIPPSSQPMQFEDPQDHHATAGLSRNGSIRRPSLPDVSMMSSISTDIHAHEMSLTTDDMSMNPPFWGPVPMFNESGALQSAYPTPDGKLQFVGVPSSQFAQMDTQCQPFAPQLQQPPHLHPLHCPSPSSSGHSPHSQQLTPQPHHLQPTLSMQSLYSASSSNSSAMGSATAPPQQPGMIATGLEVHQYQPPRKEESYGSGMSEQQQQPPPQKVYQFIKEEPANYSGK
ncbi:hypothetical protein P152DRAFT_469745 [Eremomyces bilateralis CBS 781.70]|uniref:Homeobox domain-containing protein n=1 Tax=Eremomyces bilateralis CBS 781.70 TaxID=1392243 RepID=A0A6G1GH15_9PEZI|nr:uncharacterized protein P152DRAFT_469745 [Eremomyces bilateralis CBS 781.70]KAF1817282.1 hypothetical protein P152DRAFT_469745 [Eremomyces bilateralis CBS 781.70]